MGVRCWWIDINLSPSISVCGFPLFAERFLFNLWVLWEIIFPTNLLYSFSHRVTQKNRFHKGGTETLSQPIAQNVTANISYNALWYLSPSIGVCGFSLFAERLLFNLWVLWEISSPTNLLLSVLCLRKLRTLLFSVWDFIRDQRLDYILIIPNIWRAKRFTNRQHHTLAVCLQTNNNLHGVYKMNTYFIDI